MLVAMLKEYGCRNAGAAVGILRCKGALTNARASVDGA